MSDVFLDLGLDNLRTAAARLEEAALDFGLAVRDHGWDDGEAVQLAVSLARQVDALAAAVAARAQASR